MQIRDSAIVALSGAGIWGDALQAIRLKRFYLIFEMGRRRLF